ncbi:hypothetical protein B0T10DRAFT_581188 [Thelonectria olida]|uniref:Zn(2)-C6 fungal-type domain-containing protein n=1 Tax=Thelonectria olida TaxID=1576542 RepID=A0A9P8VZ95_9HYPO|nr:hypothetical protein B0T10DRAFT_581188 [Thelonectria olida]
MKPENFFGTMPVCGIQKSLPSVPRSKGCLTCVSRKTRCDGRRPTCRACENRMQICGGYRRQELVFLSEGWRAPGVASTARSKMEKSNNTGSHPPLQSSNSGALARSRTSADLVLYASPAVGRSHLHIAFFMASFGPRPFQAPVFIVDIFRHYFSLVSPHEHDDPKDSPSPSRPVILAVDALAYAHFGMANADAVSVRRSYQTYGMALHAMSVRLAELKRADSDFEGISEEDWQHLSVFCLVMMFWEVCSIPPLKQSHIRGLSAAISIRDTDHEYSETNSRLLAFSRVFIMLQTLSARQPSFLSNHDWRQRSPIRSAWLIEMRSVLAEAESPKFSTDFELYTSADSMMMDATTIVSIMAQYDQLLTKMSTTSRLDNEDPGHVLSDLYSTTESILSRNEVRLACWNSNIREISLSSWLSLHQDVAADPISGHFWSRINGADVQPYFETIFSFRSMMEYHSIAVYWTIVMSLRLLLSDMLTLVPRTNAYGLSTNPEQMIESHRIQLMKYSLKVLQAICYSTLAESRAVAPFLAAPFQLTVVVLERECKFLQAAGGIEKDRLWSLILYKSFRISGGLRFWSSTLEKITSSIRASDFSQTSKNTEVYRRLIYEFTKNVFDIWMPAHLKKICWAINQLPANLDFDIPSLPETGLS